MADLERISNVTALRDALFGRRSDLGTSRGHDIDEVTVITGSLRSEVDPVKRALFAAANSQLLQETDVELRETLRRTQIGEIKRIPPWDKDHPYPNFLEKLMYLQQAAMAGENLLTDVEKKVLSRWTEDPVIYFAESQDVNLHWLALDTAALVGAEIPEHVIEGSLTDNKFAPTAVIILAGKSSQAAAIGFGEWVERNARHPKEMEKDEMVLVSMHEVMRILKDDHGEGATREMLAYAAGRLRLQSIPPTIDELFTEYQKMPDHIKYK
jgi:hypothetical protein